ncbi:MAG: hypothetical protein WAL25_14085, partial [Acidimicrobiia bacterium]
MRTDRVLVGLLTGLVLSLASVAIAQDVPFMAIEPTRGAPGTEVALSGGGFPNSPQDLRVEWTSGQVVQEMKHEAMVESGELTGTAEIPASATSGEGKVELCALDTGFDDVVTENDWFCASASFEVVPLIIEVNPSSGTPGAEFEITGSGLPIGGSTEWNITWGPDRIVVGTLVVGEDGTFTGDAMVPSDASEGDVPVEICRSEAFRATSATPACASADAPFQVRLPEVTATPAELLAGTPFDLSGEEWCCPGSTGQVRDTVTDEPWGEVVVDESRTLRGTAVVPEGTNPGEHQLEVCVIELCRTVSVTIIPPAPTTTSPPGVCGVQPGSLLVEPASGLPGSAITVDLIGSSGSPPSCFVVLQLAGQDLAEVELTPGELTAIEGLVPADLDAGAAELIARDPISGEALASTFFNVEGLTAEPPFPWIWVAGGVALLIALIALMRAMQRPKSTIVDPVSDLTPDRDLPKLGLPVVPARWVEARLYARDGVNEEPVAYFRSGATHRIEVQVGASSLPGEEVAPQVMRVVLTEPDLMDAPQTAEIIIRDSGASTSASLTMAIPEQTASVHGRLLLIDSANRIVQSARLPATVGEPPPTQPHNVATTESVFRAATVPVTGAGVAAAVAVGGGRFPDLTVVSGSEPAELIRLPDTGAEAVERIRHRLADIVDSPDDFSSLDSEDTRSLLIFLANHGVLLRNAIVTDFLGEALAASTSIQLASMVPDAYLPLEFAYEFPAPDTSARLCDRAGDTLRSVEPLAPCPGMHDEMVVCPLGFWGLTKVIERHTFQKRDDLPDGFLARAQPVGERNRIIWDGGVIVAWSQRIDAHDRESSARLRAGLETR